MTITYFLHSPSASRVGQQSKCQSQLVLEDIVLPTVIKNFPDGSQLTYDRGKFDAWCVYLDGRPPRDADYFLELVELGVKYGSERVYGNFVSVYEYARSYKRVTKEGHALIDLISDQYGEDALHVNKLLTILLAAMVAEENKAHTRLGAKIKHLGVYQILKDDPPLSVAEAAKFSYGMGWRDIDAQCAKRGF